MQINYIYLPLILIFLVQEVAAQAFSEVPPTMQTGGWVNTRKVKALPPANTPTLLAPDLLTENQQEIIRQSKTLSQNKSNLSVLLIERGKLLLETHNYPSREQNPLHSHSMSKTLTAFLVGNMHCDGKIGGLEQAAANYSPLLKDTVYGEASIKNLLTMSSGGVPPKAGSGDHKPFQWRSITQGQYYSILDYITEFKNRDSGLFGFTKSGSKFVYSNADTASLGLIIETNGGFVENFNRYFWSKIGAESKGYWFLDKDNRAVSYGGFDAVARDWARLAIFSLNQLKSGNSCIKEFMREATSPQIPNYDTIGKSFRHYGYQTWIGNFGPRPSYWYNGYAGQRIGVDPEKERILIVFSWREDYMDQVYDFFGRWQQM